MRVTVFFSKKIKEIQIDTTFFLSKFLSCFLSSLSERPRSGGGICTYSPIVVLHFMCEKMVMVYGKTTGMV